MRLDKRWWLLVGLVRRGHYRPGPGWRRFGAQAVAGSALLGVFLLWAARHFDWLHLPTWPRIGLLAGVLAVAALIYFGALAAAGLRLRQLLRR